MTNQISEKPTTVRIASEIKDDLQQYMDDNNIKVKAKAINELVAEGLRSKKEKSVKNIDAILNREYNLTNFIQMGAFLMMKNWEAKENDGYTVIKTEELKRIEEFLNAFNNLAHNSSLWRERFRDEGYTKYVEVIEEARTFM